MENKADLDTENDEGVSALVAAATSNKDIIVKYLLDKGATFKGVHPSKLMKLYADKDLLDTIVSKIFSKSKQNVNWLTLKMLEDTGSVLPAARIRLHLGIDPKRILSDAIQGGHRHVVNLLQELDDQEKTTMSALNCSCLKAQTKIIMEYTYPKRLDHSVLFRAL